MAIDATVAGANANSYITEEEADTYFEGRIPLNPPWVPGDAKNAAAIITATRTIDAMAMPHKRYMPCKDCDGVMVVGPTWTGAPATDTQALDWPRINTFDSKGRPIPPDVIPVELKNAVAEFAGQLLKADTTLDSDVIVQGISSVRAGSVSVSFKDKIYPKVVPDAVLNYMPASWMTDVVIIPMGGGAAEFDVIGDGCCYPTRRITTG